MTRSYIWQHTQLDNKAVKPSFSGRNIERVPGGGNFGVEITI